MKLTLLSAADVRQALPMEQAIETARTAFVAQSAGRAVAPPRSALVVEPAGGTTLVMPAHLAGTALVTKVVSVFPDNARRGRPAISGLVLVLDEGSGEPAALIDGTFLTAWRTGAACGAASDALALAGARVGAVLGTGAQARTQALAMDTVRDLEELRVWSRDPGHVRAFVEALAPELRTRPVGVATAAEAVVGAQLVCTATPAREPLFRAALLEEGAHLNAVGSFTHAMVEFDPELTRLARVFVDDRAAARAEAGELERARVLGISAEASWTELGQVLSGQARGRRDARERTLFKSVGLAVQDLTAAAAALAGARERGLGREVEL